MRARHFTLAALVAPVFLPAALLVGCKSVEVPKLPGVTPYRMVIQQGNFISDDMIAQLKPGMSKEQVRFVLGTPLVTDIFHADRWDYVFFREMPNGKREQRNLSVVFQDGKLQRVIGDLLPDPNAPKPAPTAQPSPKPEDAKPAPTAKPAGEEPKPAAEAKPAEPAKPAQATENGAPTQQNWGSAPVEEPKPEPTAKQEEEQKPAEEKKGERGFFGRMWDKITPGPSTTEATATEAPKAAEAPVAEPKPDEQPAAEAKPEATAEVKQDEKPAEEEKKERGFFGRMLEKIGL